MFYKLKSLAGVWFEAHHGMSKLTFTPGLFHMPVVGFDFQCKCFAESDGRFPDDCIDFKFMLEPVNNDLEVKFAHSGDHGFFGFFIISYIE